MAAFVDVPLGRLADPTDLTYIPRPDWYFLFLFQTLKFFKGSLEPVGSILLPSLGVGALILAPFIDRGKLRNVTKRITAIGVVCLAAITWGALTFAAIKSTPPSAEEQAAGVQPAQTAPPAIGQFAPQELAGLGYFRQEKCQACHTLPGSRTDNGPDLAAAKEHRNAEWMIKYFKYPTSVVPGSHMSPIQLSDANLDALAAFLLKLTPENAHDIASIPDNIVHGAQIYQEQSCGSCHIVNGVGAKLGPALNGLATRHDQQWVTKHFANPAAMSPGSIMPPTTLPPKEMQELVDYLFSLSGS
jgi:ubiquinol-cytochrome c reductase cytochrome b subunit